MSTNEGYDKIKFCPVCKKKEKALFITMSNNYPVWQCLACTGLFHAPRERGEFEKEKKIEGEKHGI